MGRFLLYIYKYYILCVICVYYILYILCVFIPTRPNHARTTALRQIGYINGFIVREAQRLNREQQQQVGQQLGGVEGQEGGQQQQQQQQQQQGKALLRVPTHEMLLRLIRAAEGGVGGCTNV